MAKFVVNGGLPLRGAVRLGGAKNASFKLMIAATLADSESRLLNLSRIGDVSITEMTLKELGVGVRRCGERTLLIQPNGLRSIEVPQFNGEKSRAATLLASVLLVKQGRAVIPLPGGCVLGERPINRHLDALQAMGVKAEYKDKQIYLTTKGLRGTTYRFVKKTHTGTESLILAAVMAQGKTVIENAGQEPEIDDLIIFLNKMGAKVTRQPGDVIKIEGVKNLKGAVHRVMPDRNEAVSYAVAAIATKGDIVVEDAKKEHLETFLQKLNEAGAKYEIGEYGIRFWYENELKATSIKTAPEPGFMTDWQPLWSLLMTQAKGESEIIEAVHNNRLQFTQQLVKMGARISLFNPEVSNPKDYYEFDNPEKDKNLHAARISGPTNLHALNLKVPDLRAGATLTVAALIAQGKSVLEDIEHIERGYEDLDGRLQQLGANIHRTE
ncbi:MAG: UDP-N-acetylglucosamine 1-carboxyvinyltransferase [Patescibacteria group bacterium]|jgi:UDP-N-acetylglucosamine 1-carboxyvinyltransferase